MNKRNFDELVESMRDGGAILKGTKKAARTWTVEITTLFKGRVNR